MNMHEPSIRQTVNKGAGKGQKGSSHVAAVPPVPELQVGSHVYDAAQDSDSDAFKHPSASGFSPKGNLDTGNGRGKSAPNLTEPYITTKVDAPSGGSMPLAGGKIID